MKRMIPIAAIAVLVGAVLDGLDGRVARMTNTQSEFGAEYDSLSDVVSFGVAPALIVYLWALQDVAAFGWQNIGWVFAFLYAACAALRLARFNVQIGKVDKRFFQGLAVPAAASIMVCLVWVADDLGYRGADFTNLCLAFSVVIGLLMVSKFPYYSFKDLGSGVRIPFIALLVPVLLLFVAAIDRRRLCLRWPCCMGYLARRCLDTVGSAAGRAANSARVDSMWCGGNVSP